MNKIYSNKNKIYSNKNKIYRNTHVNIQKSTTVLEDPGTQQRCFRMCGRLEQCVQPSILLQISPICVVG